MPAIVDASAIAALASMSFPSETAVRRFRPTSSIARSHSGSENGFAPWYGGRPPSGSCGRVS